MREISIQKVLAEIRSNEEGRPFLLKFVRSNKSKNGEKGSIKTVAKALYGRSVRIGDSNRKNASSVHHKSAGTIPITDTETNIYMTPLISHLVQFNSFKIKH